MEERGLQAREITTEAIREQADKLDAYKQQARENLNSERGNRLRKQRCIEIAALEVSNIIWVSEDSIFAE